MRIRIKKGCNGQWRRLKVCRVCQEKDFYSKYRHIYVVINLNVLEKSGYHVHAYKKNGSMVLGFSKESRYMLDSEARSEIIPARKAVAAIADSDPDLPAKGVRIIYTEIAYWAEDALRMIANKPIYEYRCTFANGCKTRKIGIVIMFRKTRLQIDVSFSVARLKGERMYPNVALARELKYKAPDESENPEIRH